MKFTHCLIYFFNVKKFAYGRWLRQPDGSNEEYHEIDVTISRARNDAENQSNLYFSWRNPISNPITYMFVENDLVPVSLKKDNNQTRLQTLTQINFIIDKALKLWETSNMVKFKKVSNITEAEIKISFEKENHQKSTGCRTSFDGKYRTLDYVDRAGNNVHELLGTQLAHAIKPVYTRSRWNETNFHHEMLNGDLHYDADENWYFLGEGFMPQDDDLIKQQLIEYYPNINYQEEAVVELFATTVHEIGHSLGLDHNKKDSIMNYYYLNTWDSSTNVLPEQDKYDIYMKYGSGRITFNSVWFLIVGAVLIVVLSVAVIYVSRPEQREVIRRSLSLSLSFSENK